MANFDTVARQNKLAVRKAPYWQRLKVGQHIGVRKTGLDLHWQAKSYDSATRKETVRSLGDFGHLPAHERYSAAVDAARAWFKHLGMGGRHESLTVAGAWLRYAERQRKTKGDAAGDDVESRFKRHVLNDPIAAVPIEKLNRRLVEEWRHRIANMPAMRPKRGARCRVKTELPPPRAKSQGSVNRDLVPMRAALTLALADGFATSDHAWRQALAPTKDADGRRLLYLDRDQRRALVAALPADAAALVRGLCLLPLRPGSLAALTVADFDGKHGTLRIGIDKAGAGRFILLPPATAELFRTEARGKLPAAPLLSRWNGAAWDKDAWKLPIKAGAAAAHLPGSTTAYTLRHSTITDLVSAGLDLFTVAALAGTSIAMIEKHYGHLQQERARDALAGLAL